MPNEHMIKRAKELRRKSTLPEKILWKYLKDSAFAGLKFRRQHPIGPYVADFCCVQEKLVVELDGESHDFTERKDRERDEYLHEQRFRVLRLTNDDVFEDVEIALKMIAKELNLDWQEASQRSTWRKE